MAPCACLVMLLTTLVILASGRPLHEPNDFAVYAKRLIAYTSLFNRFAHSAGPELVSCLDDLFVWLFGWLVAGLLACVIAFWVLVGPFWVLVKYLFLILCSKYQFLILNHSLLLSK